MEEIYNKIVSDLKDEKEVGLIGSLTYCHLRRSLLNSGCSCSTYSFDFISRSKDINYYDPLTMKYGPYNGNRQRYGHIIKLAKKRSYENM